MTRCRRCRQPGSRSSASLRTPRRSSRFCQKDGLNFTLVSDPDKKVLTKYGVFGEKKMYGKTVVGVIDASTS